MIQRSPFRYFKTSPEVVCLAVVRTIRFLPLRNVGSWLHEHGIEVSRETVSCWWHRFEPVFAAENGSGA